MTHTDTAVFEQIFRNYLLNEEALRKRPIRAEELDAIAQGVELGSAVDFRAFRKHMRPGMLTNWWTDEIAAALQQFYEDLMAGRRPKLECPSNQINDMVASECEEDHSRKGISLRRDRTASCSAISLSS